MPPFLTKRNDLKLFFMFFFMFFQRAFLFVKKSKLLLNGFEILLEFCFVKRATRLVYVKNCQIRNS